MAHAPSRQAWHLFDDVDEDHDAAINLPQFVKAANRLELDITNKEVCGVMPATDPMHLGLGRHTADPRSRPHQGASTCLPTARPLLVARRTSREQIMKNFQKIGMQHNGVITYATFCRWLASRPPPKKPSKRKEQARLLTAAAGRPKCPVAGGSFCTFRRGESWQPSASSEGRMCSPRVAASPEGL